VPIDIKCAKCGGKFRVPDKFAGKKAKCAKCGAPIAIPALDETPAEEPAAQPEATKQAETPAETEPVDKPEWYMQTDDGEEYGPVTRKDLDSWVTDGRIDNTCQILRDGWEQWKWAEDVFPELGGAASESPFEGIGGSSSTSGAATGEVNPFESPAQPTEAAPQAGADGGAITPTITRALAENRPWVMFLSILGFLTGGVVSLMGMFMGLAAVMSGEFIVSIAAAFYVFIAFLYVMASYYLFTYSSKISAFMRGKSTADLENALVAQKSFWKLVGIVTAVCVVLNLLMIVGMMVMGGLAAVMVGSAVP